MEQKLLAANLLRRAVQLLRADKAHYGCFAMCDTQQDTDPYEVLQLSSDAYQLEAGMHQKCMKYPNPWFWDTGRYSPVTNDGTPVDPELCRAARIQCMLDAAEVLERGTAVQAGRLHLQRVLNLLRAQPEYHNQPGLYVCDAIDGLYEDYYCGREYAGSLGHLEAHRMWEGQRPSVECDECAGWWPRDEAGREARIAALIRAIEGPSV